MAKTAIERREKFTQGAFLTGLMERLDKEARIVSPKESTEAFVIETFLAIGWKLGRVAKDIAEGKTYSIVFEYDYKPVMKFSSTNKDGAFQIGVEIVQKPGDEIAIDAENETVEVFGEELRKVVFKKVLKNYGYTIKHESFLELFIETTIAELIRFTKETRDEGEVFVLEIDDVIAFIASENEITAVAEKELKKLIKNDSAVLD